MAEMWYYTCEGKQMDAVTITELKTLVGDGTLKPTDMVWKDGMPRWIRASSLKELFPDPLTALDKYFTGAKAAPASSSQGATPKGMPPVTDAEGQRKRRPADGEPERPSRRRMEPKAGGSNAGILVALVFAVLVLLGGLLVGVIILVVAIKPEGDPKKPLVVVEKKEILVTPINGEEKFDLQIRANEMKARTFTFRKGVPYDIRVAGQLGIPGVTLHVFIFRNNKQEAVDDGPGPDRQMRWTPLEDGDYRVEVKNAAGGREVTAEVSIKESAQPLAKNEPLPKGVREKQGVVESPKVIFADGSYQMRFRVAAGYAANLTATALGGAPGANLKMQVTKPGEPNAIAADDGGKAAVRVSFTLKNQEIVVVRVQNTGKRPTRIQIIYDVSP